MADPDLSTAIRQSTFVEKKLTATHRDILVRAGPQAGVGLRIDRFLALALPTLSRSLIKGWLERGFATMDGKVVKPSAKVVAEAEIRLRCPLPPNPEHRDFVPGPLHILYDEAGVLIADKPPGQLAHQAGRVLTGTVLNQIQDLIEERGGDPREARLVNRIDQYTSGIIVCALDAATNRILSTALQDGGFRKEYLAICHGVPEPRQGHWRQAIRDDPSGGSIARQLHPQGQPSHTGYRVVETVGEAYALLRIDLYTGRQHQIRVHAAGNGHPLVGDWTYGPACRELPGQALHAALIEFPHPGHGRTVRVEAPLHPRLAALWEGLQAGGSVTPRELDEEERRRLGLSDDRHQRRLVAGGWVLPSWLPRDDYERLARELGEGTAEGASDTPTTPSGS